MNTTNTWREIIKKYFSNTISGEELNQLLQMTKEHHDPEALIETLKAHWEDSKQMHEETKVYWNDKFATMMEETRHIKPFKEIVQTKKPKRTYRAIAAAAMVILLVGIAYLKLNTGSNHLTKQFIAGVNQNDILPGGNKAILTLSNGTNILLDSSANGILAVQGNTSVVKVSNGTLIYKSNSDTKNSGEVLFNTISTPRGGQYKLALPDGSLVWLNSASSIHFPTAFTGKERKVEITGEAYFEVTKNVNMPFLVTANGMNVQVLGTHFNIMAYTDEGTAKTTLIEGVVKVSKGNASAILQPGEQAQLNDKGELKLIENANVDGAIAWKNGYFYFDNSNLQYVMRQLSRWYNVEVMYEGIPSERTFGGEISRNLNATEVLKILDESKVHFRVEGNKIIVNP